MKPHRIQRRRTKGWRMPPDTVYVGRPTIWGNPFRTGGAFLDVALYRGCTSRFPIPPELIRKWREAGGDVAHLVCIASRVWPILSVLRGKHLCCWCPPDRVCHADILLAIVNEEVAT